MCKKTPRQMLDLVRSHANYVDGMKDYCEDYVVDLRKNTAALEAMIEDLFGCSALDLWMTIGEAHSLDETEEDWTSRQIRH